MKRIYLSVLLSFAFIIFIKSSIYAVETDVVETGRQVCVGKITIICNSEEARSNIAKAFHAKLQDLKLIRINQQDYFFSEDRSFHIDSPVKILEYEGLFQSVDEAYSYLQNNKILQVIPSSVYMFTNTSELKQFLQSGQAKDDVNICLIAEKDIEIRDEQRLSYKINGKTNTWNTWRTGCTISLTNYIKKGDIEKINKKLGEKRLSRIIDMVFFVNNEIKVFKDSWSKYFKHYPRQDIHCENLTMKRIGDPETLVVCGIFESDKKALDFRDNIWKLHYKYAKSRAKGAFLGLPMCYVNNFILFDNKYFLVTADGIFPDNLTEKINKEYKLIKGAITENKYALNYVLSPYWAKKLKQYFPNNINYSFKLYNNVVTYDCGNFVIRYTDYRNFSLNTGLKLFFNKQISFLASREGGMNISPDIDLFVPLVKYIVEKIPDTFFYDWDFYRKGEEDKYIGKVLVVVSALERVKNDANMYLINDIIKNFIRDKLTKK